MVLFGFSDSLAWAIASRGLCGLFNGTIYELTRILLKTRNISRLTCYREAPGNAGVARTAVGELAHNANLDQAKAFSLFGFCSAIGYVIGPLIGGLLSDPAERFSWKTHDNIFVIYPYLLPCIVSGCYNTIVCGISWWLLQETNQKSTAAMPVAGTAPKPPTSDPESVAEQEPLLRSHQDERFGGFLNKATLCCVVGIA